MHMKSNLKWIISYQNKSEYQIQTFIHYETPTARQNAILYFMKLPVLDTPFK